MSEWKKSTLGSLCEYVARGITPKYTENSGIVVLNQKCIRDFYVNIDLARKHDINKKNVSEDKTLHKYDILINSTGVGTAGRIAQWESNEKATCDSHITIVRADENKINKLYLGYAVKAQQSLIQTYAEGSTGQTEMNKQRLCEEIIIKYPQDKEEQQGIANFLKNVDDKIVLNNKINDNLEQQAQAIFKSWFVDFEPFGGVMPSDWCVGTIGDIIELHDSKRIPLSGSVRDKMTNKTVPYYGAASLMDYVENYIFDGTYLLLGEDGTVVDSQGYPVLQYVWGKFWVNNHAHILTGKNGFCVESLYLLFKQTPIKSVVTGAVQPKISQTNLKSIETIIPELKVMNIFNSLIAPFFMKIKSNKDEVQRLTQLRDTLLPRLMSGEIDVSQIKV